MGTRIEITCITRTERFRAHQRILSIGGKTADGRPWKISHEGAMRGIQAGKYDFYMTRSGRVLNVVVAISLGGFEYLKTVADDEQPNSLLSLPDCPARP